MAGYSIEELAEVAELPVRTLRYYQAAGLLHRARREGRAMQYDESHLQRLRHIAELRGNGLKLSAIRDALANGHSGTAPVVSVLGGGQSGDWWLADSERDFTVPELAEFLGEHYFDMLGALEESGFLERRHGDRTTTWHCPDLPLLRGALQLSEIGIDVAVSAEGRDLIQRRLRSLAEDLAEMWTEEPDTSGTADAGAYEAYLERVRAVAWQSAAYVMAKEIERTTHRFEADPGEA